MIQAEELFCTHECPECAGYLSIKDWGLKDEDTIEFIVFCLNLNCEYISKRELI